MSTVEDLLAQRHAIRRQLSEVTAEAAAESAAAKRARRVWKLTGSMRRVALTAFALADCKAGPAVKYLQTCRLVNHWPYKSAEDVAAMVEDMWLSPELTLAELNALTNADNPLDANDYAEALKYVEEWRLVQWTAGWNHRSVKPSSERLLAEAEARRQQLPPFLRPNSRGTGADARGRKWCVRFRRRWQGRVAELPEGRQLGPEECLRKARGASLQFRRVRFHFLREMSAVFRAQIQARQASRCGFLIYMVSIVA